MRASAEGILYPKNAKSSLVSFSVAFPSEGRCIEIPHASWQACKDELDKAFSSVKGRKPDYIFFLAPLHKGPVGYGDENPVYTPENGILSGGDWEIPLLVPEDIRPYLVESDDICSEEHSLEIASPYISLLFPDVPVCLLLASGNCDNLRIIVKKIENDYPNALVFISNNRETCCAQMWKEAFSDVDP